MNINSPYLKIFARMQKYGIVLGALTGALVIFALMSPRILDNFLYFGYVLFLSVPVGGFAGVIIGGFIGFVSGILMMLTTAVFFQRIKTPRAYQVVMGLLVFVFTSLFVIESTAVGLANLIPESEFLRPLYISIILAVYASQITARRFLHERRGRKVKQIH